mmetsp:Transcript_26488/g.106030  ORF Transcript_26488/g.106030 Transcript_26488/m.106030 type:complete len:209 (+) Transcript_26488:3133-3759(+)
MLDRAGRRPPWTMTTTTTTTVCGVATRGRRPRTTTITPPLVNSTLAPGLASRTLPFFDARVAASALPCLPLLLRALEVRSGQPVARSWRDMLVALFSPPQKHHPLENQVDCSVSRRRRDPSFVGRCGALSPPFACVSLLFAGTAAVVGPTAAAAPGSLSSGRREEDLLFMMRVAASSWHGVAARRPHEPLVQPMDAAIMPPISSDHLC